MFIFLVLICTYIIVYLFAIWYTFKRFLPMALLSCCSSNRQPSILKSLWHPDCSSLSQIFRLLAQTLNLFIQNDDPAQVLISLVLVLKPVYPKVVESNQKQCYMSWFTIVIETCIKQNTVSRKTSQAALQVLFSERTHSFSRNSCEKVVDAVQQQQQQYNNNNNSATTRRRRRRRRQPPTPPPARGGGVGKF